jgi:hypothetical protein
MNLRYFPMALYLRLFGTAGIGYVIGSNSIVPKSMMTWAIISGLSCVLFVAGWYLMRPLMAQARIDIAAANRIEKIST